MRRFVASLLLFGLLSGTAVLVHHDRALAQKEKEKEKEPKKAPPKKEEDGLKDQWPKITEGTVVKITKVDVDKKSVDVEDGSGKKMSLAVTADTKFFGPQGGKSEDKIKDDRFTAGYTAKILTDKSGKTLTEVYLAYRIKKEMKDDKKPDEKKPEEKKKDEKKKPEEKKKEEKK